MVFLISIGSLVVTTGTPALKVTVDIDDVLWVELE